MRTWFISDLHLDESRPGVTALFFAFLKEQLEPNDTLYILGDFFEAWIGDDKNSLLISEVTAALASTSKRAITIFLMHGNRDFLIGQDFCKKSHCTLLAEPTIVDLYGRRALLVHGDSLCTKDESYQMLRQKIRDPAFTNAFLAKPLAEREALAQQYRLQSQAANSLKSESIMDVTPDAVTEIMQNHHADTLIHGHTHRPGVHQHKSGTRFVLDAWEPCAFAYCFSPNNWSIYRSFSYVT